MKSPESCVINLGKTTSYFKLERGNRQREPILAYLFIIALEVFFSLIKANLNIEGQQLLSHAFLYSAYTNDLYLIRNEKSTTEVIKTFDKFSLFSGLNINNAKCEIAGIGVLKCHSVEWNVSI